MNPSVQAAAPFIEVRNLTRHFGASQPLTRIFRRAPARVVRAVDDVSFDIGRGETLALVGESGCGKTTLARLIAGLVPASAGSVHYDGIDVGKLRTRAQWAPVRRQVQMIFQNPYASLNPRWRVHDIVAEPIRTHRLLTSRSEIMRRVEELLVLVGLAPSDARKFPYQFSGGQRQRISIARALSSNPAFLICDEPTSALDVSVQAQILNLMKDLQEELGLTYLFISHNLAAVHHIASRVGVMYLGRIVELGEASEVFKRPQHPYTKQLLNAIPALDPDIPLQPILGEIPNSFEPPTGCTFHPRCPWTNDRCVRERPQMTVSPTGRVACHAVQEGRTNIGSGATLGNASQPARLAAKLA